MLQREFNERPGLTPDQFFTIGFIEAKVNLVIACCNIVKAHLPPKKPEYKKKANQEGPLVTESRNMAKNSDGYDEDIENARSLPQFMDKKPLSREPQMTEDDENLFNEYIPPNKKTHKQYTQETDHQLDNLEEKNYAQNLGSRPRLAEQSSLKELDNYPKPSQVVRDEKDTIIINQRQFIQELKGLILTTNDNLKSLTERFSQFGSEMLHKIESLEARVKMLEAILVIKRDSVIGMGSPEEDWN